MHSQDYPLINVREATPDVAVTPHQQDRGWFENPFAELGIACEIVLPGGKVVVCGEGAPQFRITVHDSNFLRRPHDELSLAEAYVAGKIDLEGDMLAILEVRKHLADRFRLGAWLRFVKDLFLMPAGLMSKRVIDRHYTFGNAFYFHFLDTSYRFYSQCLFENNADTLEQAAEHKLKTAFQALDLRPGMRLLDIGAGWGGVFEYGCPLGVKVTGVTLFENSYNYIRELMDRKHLNGEVLLQDFLTYRPDQPFDAILTYGVIEHIPNYRRFFARVWECLKPGGRIYIDGSATKEKHALSQFARRYIWQGTHSCMCLQQLVQEALYHGFEIMDVKEESHDYELTMLHWAQRLDRHRQEIVARWGEPLYRRFRLFLWGGVVAFRDDQLQAYHVLARRGDHRGPRPGIAHRVVSFIRDMA